LPVCDRGPGHDVDDERAQRCRQLEPNTLRLRPVLKLEQRAAEEYVIGDLIDEMLERGAW
jgi:Na+/phosphate symporter